MRVKELPEREHPREQRLDRGAEVLPGRDAAELAVRLIARTEPLRALPGRPTSRVWGRRKLLGSQRAARRVSGPLIVPFSATRRKQLFDGIVGLLRNSVLVQRLADPAALCLEGDGG